MGYFSYELNDDMALNNKTICERKKFILILKYTVLGYGNICRFKSHLFVQSQVKFFGYVANTVCMSVHTHTHYDSLVVSVILSYAI